MSVADIEQARQDFGADLNLQWTELLKFDALDFWTPEEGTHKLDVIACYSKPGPHHLELVQGPVGSFYDVSKQPDKRHIGVWVDDLTDEAHRLMKAGWTVKGASASPEDGFGMIAYLSAPIPGLLVELVSTDLEEIISGWLR